MNDWELLCYVFWCVAALLLLWIVVDAIRVSRGEFDVYRDEVLDPVSDATDSAEHKS
jgi:hypothetical protein